jgi:Tfp pilus assembly protein PilZ
MEDRKEKRVYGIKSVTIKDEDKTISAVIKDMSKKGISIKSEHVFPTYKVIDIILKINEKTLNLKGSVRWVNEHPDKTRSKLKEIGISIINPTAEYLQYIKKLSE